MWRNGLTALGQDDDDRVALAVALAVRALRGGSVCVDLPSVADHGRDAGAALAAAGAVGWPRCGPARWPSEPVLRLYGDLLYLDRYWREEQQVCDDVLALLAAPPRQPRPGRRAAVPRRLGRAARRRGSRSARSRLTVLTGGPGTGKTTTVARLLAAIAEQAEIAGGAPPRMALAAPTGKAAARLQEAVPTEVEPARRRWTGPGWRGCRPPRCTDCWAAGRTRRHGSGITATTGCRTT